MLPVDLLTLLAFIPAGLALNLTPGADMMFVLAQGMRDGGRAGMAANLGIAAGCVVHVLIAALGLAVFLQAHPAAFEVIRWGGVFYLLWLAVRMWRAPPPEAAMARAASAGRIFRQALVVNLLNPKVALFILAFVPQFVAPGRAVLPQFLVLGAVFCLTGLLVNGAVALAAARIGHILSHAPQTARSLNRLAAAVMAGLALRLAMMERA